MIITTIDTAECRRSIQGVLHPSAISSSPLTIAASTTTSTAPRSIKTSTPLSIDFYNWVSPRKIRLTKGRRDRHFFGAALGPFETNNTDISLHPVVCGARTHRRARNWKSKPLNFPCDILHNYCRTTSSRTRAAALSILHNASLFNGQEMESVLVAKPSR